MTATALVIRDEKHYLTTIAEVRALTERIEHIEDAKALADKATAAKVWAQRARLGEEQVNLAAIAKLWAERRAGELLALTLRHGGDRRSESSSRTTNLKELGVTPDQSSRWQKLAEIPKDDFSAAVDQAVEEGRVTATAVRRLAVPLSDELLDEQQRAANVRHLSTCLRGLEVTPEHARAEMHRLAKGDHPFTVERFLRAAEACQAYADALRKKGDHHG